MTIELQEQFKNYVFEDVKANLDEWDSIGYDVYWPTEKYRKFRAKIIGLRRQYANENGFKTVTQLCPELSDLMDTVMKFMREYIKRERARLYEEYRPLAIAKIANDEVLRYGLNETFSNGFSEFNGGNILTVPYQKLWEALRYHYDEIKHTLSNPSNVATPISGI